MKQVIVRDNKVYIVNDVLIFAKSKNGETYYFEAPIDYRKTKVYIKNGKVLPSPNRKKKLRAKMSLEDRLAIAENKIPKRIFEMAKDSKVRMTIKEKIIITHEIDTNLPKSERRKALSSIRVGDYEYSFVNFGTNNYYFVKKKKIKAEVKS